MNWGYYKELEITFSEIMEQLDEDLYFHKNDEKSFGDVATYFLDGVKDLIDGWREEFKDLSAFHELKRVMEAEKQ